MIESGDERGKWDKKGARGTFHGEMGKWQKMAQAMTLMKRMGGREGETSNGPIHRLGAFPNPRCLPDECSAQ